MDITIDEAADCSLARIKARVNAMERQGRLPHLVVVDYIQLMDTAPAERRDLRIAALSRGLKILAKTKKIVVVALAQARRESADRENGVPRLSDLAESSALEKDPNIVLTVATPHVDDLEHERSGETIINVAKNRGGPLGEVSLACQFHYSRCANLHR
jgi:Replicative DNA helicase